MRIGNQTAIVIGSSIAGLLSARVLSDRFASVTVIDTDKLPEKPENRRGVPQSAQPHVLFTRGYRILEELFPGIGVELSAAGALSVDWAREFHHFGKALLESECGCSFNYCFLYLFSSTIRMGNSSPDVFAGSICGTTARYWTVE